MQNFLGWDGRILHQYNIIQYNIMHCNNTIYPPLLMTLPCPDCRWFYLDWLHTGDGGKWWDDTQTTFNLWWIQEIFYNILLTTSNIACRSVAGLAVVLWHSLLQFHTFHCTMVLCCGTAGVGTLLLRQPTLRHGHSQAHNRGAECWLCCSAACCWAAELCCVIVIDTEF